MSSDRPNPPSRPHRTRAAVLAIAAAAPLAARAAPHLETLYTFTGGTDGASPEPSVISGPGGAVFGATTGIGAGLPGSVYQLLPPERDGVVWRFKTIYAFTGGADGATPGNLVADAAGNLFGAASSGGSTACPGGCGTVFELSPPAPGRTEWTETTIYAFTGGADGYNPEYGLALDDRGRLFGFAGQGGDCNVCGTAFRLTPPTDSRGSWFEDTLHRFTGGAGGAIPFGVPLLDLGGGLLGVTAFGGDVASALCTTNTSGCGTVFRLAPNLGSGPVPSDFRDDAPWAMTQLRVFNGRDASEPVSALVPDLRGDLFGTALQGGDLAACTDPGYPPGCGVVFELSPVSDGRGGVTYAEHTVRAFDAGPGGDYPYTDALTSDGDGFVTTVEGDGIATFGTIVRLIPLDEDHQRWTSRTLYTFSGGADGGFPADALLRRDDGYFGTTVEGGNPACLDGGGCGTVFRLAP